MHHNYTHKVYASEHSKMYWCCTVNTYGGTDRADMVDIYTGDIRASQLANGRWTAPVEAARPVKSPPPSDLVRPLSAGDFLDHLEQVIIRTDGSTAYQTPDHWTAAGLDLRGEYEAIQDKAYGYNVDGSFNGHPEDRMPAIKLTMTETGRYF